MKDEIDSSTIVVTCGRDWSRYIIKRGARKWISFSGAQHQKYWAKIIPIYATKVYQAYFSTKTGKFRFRFLWKTGSFTYFKTAVARSKEYANYYEYPYLDGIKNHQEIEP